MARLTCIISIHLVVLRTRIQEQRWEAGLQTRKIRSWGEHWDSFMVDITLVCKYAQMNILTGPMFKKLFTQMFQAFLSNGQPAAILCSLHILTQYYKFFPSTRNLSKAIIVMLVEQMKSWLGKLYGRNITSFMIMVMNCSLSAVVMKERFIATACKAQSVSVAEIWLW